MWTGARTALEYGRIYVRDDVGVYRYRRAHQVSWWLHAGEASARGLFILHRCDNPPCVNPAHLFPGTGVDNVRDMDAKGRRRSNPRRGERCPQAKLTTTAVDEIRRSTARPAQLGARFGVSRMTIWRVRSGRAWRTG